METWLITGGAGFIGSNLVQKILREREDVRVINLDLLTYAGNLANLPEALPSRRHVFVHGDICDQELVRSILIKFEPTRVLNLAAESHVDRSITAPEEFMNSNVLGTVRLLKECLAYRDKRPHLDFLYHQISTDEVYGSLSPGDAPFVETDRYRPSTPYAAAKAAADHFVRSFGNTYDLPYIITNGSNNYGPFQFPEKFIPLMIMNALTGRPLTLHGEGKHLRDWLHVDDHCAALIELNRTTGMAGESFNVGGSCEKSSIEVLNAVLRSLDSFGIEVQSSVMFIPDRKGNDTRYGLNSTKIGLAAKWSPKISFYDGIRSTVEWYLNNRDWLERVWPSGYSRAIDLSLVNVGAVDAD